MRSFDSFRLTAQLCLGSAVFCLFSPFREDWRLFALLCALAFLAGLLAVRCRNPLGRAAIGLLPALALPLASAWLSLAAGGLIVVYSAIHLYFGVFSLPVWKYRIEALVLILLSALLALLSTLAAFRGLPSLFFGLACVCLAILALRGLRLSGNAAPLWEALNAGVNFLPPLIGAAAGCAIWFSLPLLRLLAQGLAALFGSAVSLWNSFWGWLMGGVNIGDDFHVTEPATNPIYGFTEPTDFNPLENATYHSMPKITIPWGYILAAAVAISLVLLVVWLLRGDKEAETPLPKKKDSLRLEDDSDASASRLSSRKARKRAARSNRERVRALYRQYLLYLRTMGVRPGVSATTADITDASAALLLQTDETLRGLYRRARYGSEEICGEELQLAQEQLRQLLAVDNLRQARSSRPEGDAHESKD